MEKLNIADLLKDCPQGMELYSPIFGNVYLDKIRSHLAIVVTTDKKQGDFKEEFLYDGRYGMNGECMLFPSKDKTTWEGFQRPFKDGDIISNGEYIAIFHKFGKPDFCAYDKVVYYHCWYHKKYKESKFKKDFGIGRDSEYRFATIEEKQKLFDAIKENGYKWNSETKTLEKLIEENRNLEENKFPSFEPMFKMNDELEYKIPDGYEIIEVSKDKVFIKPIKPKYPKTYAECCKIKHCDTNFYVDTHLYSDTLGLLYKLLICRDAYWKIAGEQMGLDKPWEPKFGKYIHYSINFYFYQDSFVLHKGEYSSSDNCILVFPSEEMRDAFYENFKDLIEECKELL